MPPQHPGPVRSLWKRLSSSARWEWIEFYFLFLLLLLLLLFLLSVFSSFYCNTRFLFVANCRIVVNPSPLQEVRVSMTLALGHVKWLCQGEQGQLKRRKEELKRTCNNSNELFSPTDSRDFLDGCEEERSAWELKKQKAVTSTASFHSFHLPFLCLGVSVTGECFSSFNNS